MYKGAFWIAIFLERTAQRNTIAARSTRVTPAKSRANFFGFAAVGDNAFSTSGTYSPVKRPQRFTVMNSGFSLSVVILNTRSELLALTAPECLEHLLCQGVINWSNYHKASVLKRSRSCTHTFAFLQTA